MITRQVSELARIDGRLRNIDERLARISGFVMPYRTKHLRQRVKEKHWELVVRAAEMLLDENCLSDTITYSSRDSKTTISLNEATEIMETVRDVRKKLDELTKDCEVGLSKLEVSFRKIPNSEIYAAGLEGIEMWWRTMSDIQKKRLRKLFNTF